jgi:hypothetical protein
MITTTYPELLIFTIGIFFYSVFVWFFYRHLSKRDLFKLDLSKYELPETKWKRAKKAGSVFLYLLKYFIIFPIYVGFWFAILTFSVFLLSESVPIGQVALVSMALVATVRITSYFSEDLSRDLAKLTPFALLGVFLVKPDFFSLDLLVTRLNAIPTLGWEILRILSFCILLEWVLRLICSIKKACSRKITPIESKQID